MSYYNNRFPIEVSIDYPLYQSKEGNYFIGQTPFLTGEDKHALAMLQNPIGSNRTIYLNAMTITNAANLNISAEFYLKSSFNTGDISDLFSCTNTAVFPEPTPKGEIKYLNTTTNPPSDGVCIFSRIVSSYSTLVVDGGQIILGPGQSILIYLGGFLPIGSKSSKIAFCWWEKRIYNCPNYCC